MVAGVPERVRGDLAVSPVVGMILILAISVVGIAAILYWGLPAIDEMKANVEYRSATSQFSELDSTIRELVAGTTEKTAKRWEPSLNRGSVGVSNNTEAWLYATELYQAGGPANFTWFAISDGDNSFKITSGTALTNVEVKGYVVTGSSSQTTLNVSLQGQTTSPSWAQMQTTDLLTWSAGQTQQFSVWTTSGATQRLENATFHFKVYSGSTLLSEAWYVNTGRVEYHLTAGIGNKDVVLNNGALIQGKNGAYVLTNSPTIPPDVNASGTPRFFGRALVLGGNVSVGGTSRFSMLVSLYSTATLASYDCSKSDYSDCVATSKVFDYGTYASVWNTYLAKTELGYSFLTIPYTDGATARSYMLDKNDHMAYTLLASNLKVS